MALFIFSLSLFFYLDLPLDMSAMSVSSTKPMTSDDVIDDVTDSRQPSVQGLHSPSSTVPPPSLKPGLWVCVCVWGDVSAV